VDVAALRSQFPVLAQIAYLNSGTAGPVPQAALDAAVEAWQVGARSGRSAAYYERLVAAGCRLRELYAGLLGADPHDVALTSSTSEGVVRVLAGLDLGPGDEVLTAPDEHPGVLGPLITLRDRRGVSIATAPFSELAGAVGPATKLIACSHVSWSTGAVMPDGLADAGVPLLLDGAQGLGAIPVDVTELGCDFYAASGQKWLCGPLGTGSLWVSPRWRERLDSVGLTYVNLDDPGAGLDAAPLPDARRHDSPAHGLEAMLPAIAAIETLGAFGWPQVQARATELAGLLAAELEDRGRRVAPRGRTTLVSWEADDPKAEVARLAERDVVVRSFPRMPYVRAAVGAWNDESDLERLLAGLG
jgi:L-cysteine/cystine lyase